MKTNKLKEDKSDRTYMYFLLNSRLQFGQKAECVVELSAQEKGTFAYQKEQLLQFTVMLNPQGSLKLNEVQHISKKTTFKTCKPKIHVQCKS